MEQKYENVYDAIFTESEQARLISELNVALAEKSIALNEAQDLYVQAKKKIDDLEFEYGGCKDHIDELEKQLAEANELIQLAVEAWVDDDKNAEDEFLDKHNKYWNTHVGPKIITNF